MRSIRLFASLSLGAALWAAGCAAADEVVDPGPPEVTDDDGAGETSAGGAGPATSSSASTGGAPDPGPAVCPDATGVYEVEPAQTNLLFLLDRSGSMHLRVGANSTRWTLTTAGLADVLDALPDAALGGLSMFPTGDQPVACCKVTAGNYIACDCSAGELPGPANRCSAQTYTAPVVPVAALGPDQVKAINEAVGVSDDEFYWGTPLAPALDGTLQGAKLAGLAGVTSVVLLTDGLPTSCQTQADPKANDIQRALDAAAAGASMGVRTYVVGIDAEAASTDPATDLAVNLSALAQAGGTARYAGCEAANDCAYLVNIDNFETALAASLAEIALEAVSCSFDVPGVMGGAPNYDEVNVTVTVGAQTSTVPKDPAHQNGWDYLSGNQQIQLYGEACETLKTKPEAQVSIVIGCETVQN